MYMCAYAYVRMCVCVFVLCVFQLYISLFYIHLTILNSIRLIVMLWRVIKNVLFLI